MMVVAAVFALALGYCRFSAGAGGLQQNADLCRLQRHDPDADGRSAGDYGRCGGIRPRADQDRPRPQFPVADSP